MKRRCKNPRVPEYRNYGARGISVCERWDKSFDAFLDDMGASPTPKHTLDRIDNNGNYEPGNVRWATREEQGLNMRTNRLVTAQGKTQPVVAWERDSGIAERTIISRLNRGWADEDAVSIAPGDKPRKGMITRNGGTKTLRQWSADAGLPYHTVYARVKAYRWDIERALSTPVLGHDS